MQLQMKCVRNEPSLPDGTHKVSLIPVEDGPITGELTLQGLTEAEAARFPVFDNPEEPDLSKRRHNVYTVTL